MNRCLLAVKYVVSRSNEISKTHNGFTEKITYRVVTFSVNGNLKTVNTNRNKKPSLMLFFSLTFILYGFVQC